MPTGWRPVDVAIKYPFYKIGNVYSFEKYNTKSATLLNVWIWIQMVMLLLLISYLFGNIAKIGSPEIFLYGGFIFIYVYAYSELMDGNKYAIVWQVATALIGVGFVIYFGDWFGASKLFPWISIFLVTYFIISVAVTGLLVYLFNNKQTSQLSTSF